LQNTLHFASEIKHLCQDFSAVGLFEFGQCSTQFSHVCFMFPQHIAQDSHLKNQQTEGVAV